jgi:hypothetical protein
LVVNPDEADPQLIGPELDVSATDKRFVRLRVAASYPELRGPELMVIDWFWTGPTGVFGQSGFERAYPRRDGKPYVYWSYIPTARIEGALTALRLDPINARTPVQISWIALDVVR